MLGVRAYLWPAEIAARGCLSEFQGAPRNLGKRAGKADIIQIVRKLRYGNFY
jgi:hypothetical protein